MPELVATSKKNVENDGKKALLDCGNLVLVQGDGRFGVPQHAPYDAIHVGAAAPSGSFIPCTGARLLPHYLDMLRPAYLRGSVGVGHPCIVPDWGPDQKWRPC